MRSLNEVREALLNSTVRIVSQYGLERTTTKLIAADAQINEAYIYRCYDSKDSLLQATFHMEDVCLAEHVRKSLPVMRIRGLNWKDVVSFCGSLAGNSFSINQTIAGFTCNTTILPVADDMHMMSI